MGRLVPSGFIAVPQFRRDFEPWRPEKRTRLKRWCRLRQTQRLPTRQQAFSAALSSASPSITVSKVSCGMFSM